MRLFTPKRKNTSDNTQSTATGQTPPYLQQKHEYIAYNNLICYDNEK